MNFSSRILLNLLTMLLVAAPFSFGQQAPVVPAPEDLGALLGGLLNGGGQNAPSPQDIERMKAMRDAFLQGVIKSDQLDAIRKQAEAVQPNPEQLKQLELMAQRLHQTLGAADPLPAAPAPKLVSPKPFIP